jgi:hypothetical protein
VDAKQRDTDPWLVIWLVVLKPEVEAAFKVKNALVPMQLGCMLAGALKEKSGPLKPRKGY